MGLSIGQVAKRVGISARMLRHYDDLGLYRPTRVSRNGYRWYDEATLPRLHRIVALRRAGVGLADIAQILGEKSNEADALRTHLEDLKTEQAKLAELIASIENQIDRLEEAKIADPAGFRASYRVELDALIKRLKQRYPAPLVDSYATHARAIENMSTAEIEHLIATSATLMNRLAAMVADGVSPNSDEARRGIAAHYSMLSQSVPLTRNAYRSLGQAYLDDPLQNSIATSFHPDLPTWLARAITQFAVDVAEED
jgi:DNA-binding transcriptional MerR regulator